MSKIVIVNKKKRHPSITYDHKFYCGRGSPLGNEFNFRSTSQFETQEVSSREEACSEMRKKFLTYLGDKKNRFPKSQKVKQAFNDIFKAYRKHDTIALECYCLNLDEEQNIRHGEQCHVETIKEIIEYTHEQLSQGKRSTEIIEDLKGT